MSLGEKIRLFRKKEGFTQEELAEKLDVSRSAIAKWETNSGVPDISNLKILAHIFSVSIDELLDDSTEGKIKLLDKMMPSDENSVNQNAYYNIELNGWNDGVYNALIIGQDKDFVFYVRDEKHKFVRGLIGKKYIASVNKVKINDQSNNNFEAIEKSYFCNKHVFVELGKEGIIKGFFDFRDDDYRDVLVESLTDTTVFLKFGKEIAVENISKLEEIDS